LDRTRTVVAMLYNLNRGKKRAYKKPEKIMPLAIDYMYRFKLEWTEEKYQEFDKALKAWGLTKDGIG